MKRLFFLFLLSPFSLWAQIDSVQTLRQSDLKPIEHELLPGYGRYGPTYSSQYMYDGLDIKAKQLTPYIMASGEPTAIQEFSKYIRNRHTGGWLIGGGITAMLVGTIIGTSNSPVTVQQAITCPAGYACGGSTGTIYGGGIVGYKTVVDSQRETAVGVGVAMFLGGTIMTGIGWGMNIPGRHVRKAVQFYNRALKQRQGISWQFHPYSSYSSAGIGLSGRF